MHEPKIKIRIRDESLPRREISEAFLPMNSARVTARDLISERVRVELDNRLIDTAGNAARRLVAPTDDEAALNGNKAAKQHKPEHEIARALAAFETNAFMLLVDDHQITDLDQEIVLGDDTLVTFLRLTPLVGG